MLLIITVYFEPTFSFNSNQSDEEEMDPPEDLSSLVKVEMEEGFGPVIDTTNINPGTIQITITF